MFEPFFNDFPRGLEKANPRDFLNPWKEEHEIPFPLCRDQEIESSCKKNFNPISQYKHHNN